MPAAFFLIVALAPVFTTLAVKGVTDIILFLVNFIFLCPKYLFVKGKRKWFYSVSALDYLTKPISYQKFLEAAQKARIWFELKNAAEEPSDPPAKTGRYFFINGDKKILQKVYFSDITYIEGMKDYVLIHLTSSEEPLVTHGPLKILESVLPKGSFMRVHRSYIVALDKIDSVQPGMNIMIGKTLIHVSNVYESPFLRYLKGRSL